jgi:nucleotide-binding universal stress UspA family protein
MQAWNSVYLQWQKSAEENMKMYCEPDITPLSSESLNEAHQIVQTATDGKFDLILMPTHGYHGFQKILLGSVFQGVLLKSHVPVLALPPKFFTKGLIEFKKPLNILCPIDIQEGSAKLISFTETLAQEFDATFSILHSIDLKTELLRLLEKDTFSEEKKAARKRILFEHPISSRAHEVIVTHGVPHESILSAIEDHVDLLVLGYSLKSHKHLRSTLYRVIAELSIPAVCVAVD